MYPSGAGGGFLVTLEEGVEVFAMSGREKAFGFKSAFGSEVKSFSLRQIVVLFISE